MTETLNLPGFTSETGTSDPGFVTAWAASCPRGSADAVPLAASNPAPVTVAQATRRTGTALNKRLRNMALRTP